MLSTIALVIWFLLFAIFNLIETKMPVWILGVAAIFVVIAIIFDHPWRKVP
jgi:hypothetical protein